MSQPPLQSDDIATLAGIGCGLLAALASAMDATFLAGIGSGGAIVALAAARLIKRRARARARVRQQRLLEIIRNS